jgi:hypothetical protein
MAEVIEFLKGKKTNLLLITWLIVGMLVDESVLQISTGETIENLLIPLLGMSGAAKLDRLTSKLPTG